jgi:hypothetical protein
MRLLFASGSGAREICRSAEDTLPVAAVAAGSLGRRRGSSARMRLALGRLDTLGAALPPRLLLGTALAAAASLIPLLAHYSLACAGKYAAAAAFVAIPLTLLLAPPRAGARPARDLAGSSYLEEGFSIIEAVIAAGVVAMVVIGATVVFSQQKQSVAQVTLPDALRDQVSAVDVDANALQAYDATVQAKIQAGGSQLWTATLPGTTQLATLQAQGAPSGVTIVAKNGMQAASIIAPLPQPKPTPQ